MEFVYYFRRYLKIPAKFLYRSFKLLFAAHLNTCGQLPITAVIARSEATWQSPASNYQKIPQKQTSHREIPTSGLRPSSE